MPGDAISVLIQLVSILEELGVAYAVGGSVASSRHGEPRSTHDVDLLIDLPLSRVSELVSRVGDEFYVSEQAARRAVETTTSFNLVHLPSGHKLDLFVAGTSRLDVLQLETCHLDHLREHMRPVRVTSPAVIVLRKLSWFRSGAGVSERQWRDVVGVLRVTDPDSSLGEMREVAQELGLSELLEQAIREARDA
jgi:hypothetical protein